MGALAGWGATPWLGALGRKPNCVEVYEERGGLATRRSEGSSYLGFK